MASTPNYGFNLVSSSDSDRSLMDWVQQLSGEDETSNMMRIDALLAELAEQASGNGVIIDSSEPAEGEVWIDTDDDGTLVTSFNGRTGAVLPQTGDYTADMVGTYTAEQIDEKLGNVNSVGTGVAISPEAPDEGDVWIDTDDSGTSGTLIYSFNGRTGAIVPQSGDYTAEMVGADVSGAAAQALVNAKTYVDNKLNITFVNSFNGRSGDVKPQAGDYTAAMVGAATAEDIQTAIQAAILDSWEKSY